MEVKDEHPLNALAPISVTPLGIIMLAREEQSRKAAVPIVFKFFGRVIDLSEDISRHKWSGMRSTPSPSVKDVICSLMPSNASSRTGLPTIPGNGLGGVRLTQICPQFFAFHVIAVSAEHSDSAWSPIKVTPTGISIDSKEEQP